MSATRARRASKDALFEGFASIAKALSSGRRAEIIEVLAQGERTVDDLARELGQSIANTSHHLRTLARAGLLVSRKDGTHVHYRLGSDDVLELWWAMRKVAAARATGFEVLARRYLGDRDELPSIGHGELLARLEAGTVTLVDVRPPAEFAAGHLPGAIHVPPDRLDLLDDLPVDHQIVAYCRGPYCVYADDAVRYLRGQGREAVRLEDGLPEWRHAGHPVDV